jgi:AraC-like DNA-binding protein
MGTAILHLALRRLTKHACGEPGEALGKYWAKQAAVAIASSLHTNRGIDEILSPLEPSSRQLARYMQAEFGMSPKRYQLTLRIEEARRLLRHTRLSATTIAMELGYPSLQHFTTQFKSFTGITPTAWRECDRMEGMQEAAG